MSMLYARAVLYVSSRKSLACFGSHIRVLLPEDESRRDRNIRLMPASASLKVFQSEWKIIMSSEYRTNLRFPFLRYSSTGARYRLARIPEASDPCGSPQA